MRRVYADCQATTPLRPEVMAAMRAALEDHWGNPSSVHAYGRAARRLVETAREQVAVLIGAQPTEIFFTSGGTEANNWALRAAAHASRSRGRHIITAATEHPSVLDTCAHLEEEGFRVTYLPVEPGTGFVRPDVLEDALTDETTVVSVMYVNNEVGTVQDIPALVGAVKARRPEAVFHTDGVQAAGIIPVDVHALGVDLMTLSAHKIHGPKGVGALWVRRGFPFGPLLYGGGQERRMRAGTENVVGIVGFGAAAALAQLEREARANHMRRLRDRFVRLVRERIPSARLNGPDTFAQGERRHPGNANFTFPGMPGEALLMRLDMKGIAVSSGSACSSGVVEPSHVLLALGVPREEAGSSLRISFGAANTEEDVDYVAEELAAIAAELS